MNELLLEPLKYYERVGKQEHAKNAVDYFEDLLKQSKVDVEENRATVKAYKKEKAAAEHIRSKIRKKKALRVFLIIGIVLCGIGILVGISKLPNGAGIALLLGGIVGVIGGILLLVKKLNPSIRAASEILEKHLAKSEELLAKAEAQTAPLNALFDNTDALKLIEKTIPEFEFDDTYSVAQEDFFLERHDFIDFNVQNSSITDTLSGRFAGNPFLFCNVLQHEMRSQTYHGSLTISWTETYRDSKGNLRTRIRTQVLHASVVKPKPEFFTHQYLCYGNQAAPELSFSRKPQHSERLDEKQIERKVKKGAKKLKKKAEKATKKGGNFQEMANTEFDVLFGAEDRDHEVQFRLMYTPLAQCNTVDLLTSKTGYGDDFYFQKHKRFNVITSEHAQGRRIHSSASDYYSYDVDEAKRKFVEYNTGYFKSLFFDFAPLLSVPAYVEEPCASLDLLEEHSSNYTYYEHEVMANALGKHRLAHSHTATNAIFKTQLVSKKAQGDVVGVTAYSYAAEDRVDFIPVLGGDGHMHGVPVPWVEYIPLERYSEICVDKAPISERERREKQLFDDEITAYFHGLSAKIL